MSITVEPMIDAIHASVDNVPASAPKVAGYTTGTPDIVWTAADWARFSHSKVRICQDEGSDQSADVLDIEPGAATNANAVTWARARKTRGHVPSFYTSVSNLTPLLNTLEAAGITSGYLWVANWNLSEGEAAKLVTGQNGPFPIKAVQWASPSSNPGTLVPGTGLTLAQANCDLSVADRSWPSVPPPPLHTSAPAPPGLWKSAQLLGIGLDGNAWGTTYDAVTGKWTAPVREPARSETT